MLISNRDDVSISQVELRGVRWKAPFDSVSLLFTTTPEGQLRPTLTFFSSSPLNTERKRWTLEEGDVTLADLPSPAPDDTMLLSFIIEQCLSGDSTALSEVIAEHLLRQSLPQLVITAHPASLCVDVELRISPPEDGDEADFYSEIMADEMIDTVFERV